MPALRPVSHSVLLPTLRPVNPNWLWFAEYSYSFLCLNDFELGFLILAIKTVISNLTEEMRLDRSVRLQIQHSFS